MEYTRKDRLEDKCSHREYFAQFVTETTKETVRHHIRINKIVASSDKSMNDIELSSWDWLPQLPQSTWRKLKSLGDCITMAGKVCIYKEAAKQIQEETFESEINKFLKKYCNKGETNKESCKKSQGLTMSHSGDLEIPAGFKEQEHWGNSQSRTVWINDKTLSTITYCEGDIIVMQHSTQASYNTEIVKAAEFYKTY